MAPVWSPTCGWWMDWWTPPREGNPHDRRVGASWPISAGGCIVAARSWRVIRALGRRRGGGVVPRRWGVLRYQCGTPS